MKVKLSLRQKESGIVHDLERDLTSTELSVLREVGYLVYEEKAFTLQKNMTVILLDELDPTPVLLLVFVHFDS
ncbi:hypothetical protein FZC76_21825 [Sutcliffiella horikoshii]|uniref:Uncharacterized protein n=1 Tax=Sutcliffiella horikoshii TaxID=79883 RepID=A0A5D4SB76_9BACI|nr:hypothetical protein [Sutcliffiella horikoshii]TYS60510.1 hypothetical protein FZC76_21825 [Sutcliffiella horikoshii]